MNEKPIPDTERLEATPNEQKMLRMLRENPLMAIQFQTIAHQFEHEIACGMDAHQVEESMIEALQQLGISMMHQWAKNTQRDLIQQTPSLQQHSKKNFNGTPLSE